MNELSMEGFGKYLDDKLDLAFGIDTVIEFERPIKALYIVQNTIPFESIEGALIEPTGKHVGDGSAEDEEFNPPSEVLSNIGGNEYYRVSLETKILVVATKNWTKYCKGPTYVTSVERAEMFSCADVLKINPERHSCMEKINPQTTKTEEEALANHENVVKEILSIYEANNPKISYHGPFLLEARHSHIHIKTD